MGLNLSCKEVHRIISEGLDRDLSIVERLRLRLHLGVCDACGNFKGQINLLRHAMQRLTVPEDAEPKSNE